MSDLDLDQLAEELADFAAPEKKGGRSAREERIIAGFEEIQRFAEKHGRAIRNGQQAAWGGIFVCAPTDAQAQEWAKDMMWFWQSWATPFGQGVPELLIGSPDTISRRLDEVKRRLPEQDEVVLLIPLGLHDRRQTRTSLELMATKVMPRFAALPSDGPFLAAAGRRSTRRAPAARRGRGGRWSPPGRAVGWPRHSHGVRSRRAHRRPANRRGRRRCAWPRSGRSVGWYRIGNDQIRIPNSSFSVTFKRIRSKRSAGVS